MQRAKNHFYFTVIIEIQTDRSKFNRILERSTPFVVITKRIKSQEIVNEWEVRVRNECQRSKHTF